MEFPSSISAYLLIRSSTIELPASYFFFCSGRHSSADHDCSKHPEYLVWLGRLKSRYRSSSFSICIAKNEKKKEWYKDSASSNVSCPPFHLQQAQGKVIQSGSSHNVWRFSQARSAFLLKNVLTPYDDRIFSFCISCFFLYRTGKMIFLVKR